MVEIEYSKIGKHHLVTDRISLYIGYSRDDGGGATGGQNETYGNDKFK